MSPSSVQVINNLDKQKIFSIKFAYFQIIVFVLSMVVNNLVVADVNTFKLPQNAVDFRWFS